MKQNKIVPALEDAAKPWPGVTGFHTDLQARLDDRDRALEALNNPIKVATLKLSTPMAGDGDGSDDNTTIIYKKNDAYYVYFNIIEVESYYGTNLTSFSLWLSSLPENDVVYIHQTGSVYNLTDIVQIVGVLGTECKARKVFVVDHPIENALFLLSCDDVIITDLGALTFSNAMSIDPTRWDKIYMPYMKSLFSKAVEKNYITSQDADAIINDNAIIYKTARQLKDQGVSVT